MCISLTRLLGGAAEAREGCAAVRFLERKAEAEAVPLETARRAVSPSSSWMERPRRWRGTPPSTSRTGTVEAVYVPLEAARRAVPPQCAVSPSTSRMGAAKVTEGHAAVHLLDGAEKAVAVPHEATWRAVLPPISWTGRRR